MSAPTDCLTPDALRQLTFGDLPAEEVAGAEAHVTACELCIGRLSQLVDADRLAPLVRAAAASPVFSDSSAGEIARAVTAGLETRIAAGDATRIDPAASDAAFDLSWDEQHEEEFAPTKLGAFRIIRLLGRGGMGAVFEAEDERLRRRVALKVILPRLAQDASLRNRFLREARSIAAIRHPSIVGIYEVGIDAEVPFLAMELLHGETLEAFVSRVSPLDPVRAAAIGAECAAGLAAVHAKGLLHRDIKPGNIWVESVEHGPVGAVARIKLLDFGLARPAHDADGLTRPGVVIGTPRYLSPEQARGDVLDARSDLFSLGCVLYQMVTGIVPFDGPDVISRLNALATTIPPRVDTLNPSIPVDFARLIERLLSSDAERRPESASVVVDELRQIVNAARPLPPHSGPHIVPGSAGGGRRRTIWVAGGLAAAVMLAVIVITFQDGSKVTIESDKAVTHVGVQDNAGVPFEVTPTPQPAVTESASPPPADADPATVPPALTIQSLDHLDPQQIPASERVGGQPAELVAVIGEHTLREWSGIHGLAFDPSAGYVIADHAVVLGPHAWSTKTFEAVPFFAAEDSPQGIPRFSRDGKYAFTHGRLSRREEVVDGSPRYGHSVILPVANPQCGDFSPDGRWLVTAGPGNPQLQMWDLTAESLQPIDLGPIAADGLGRPALAICDAPSRVVVTGVAEPHQTLVYDLDWSATPRPQVTALTSYAEMWFVARSAPRALSITADGGATILDVSDAPPRVVTSLFPPRWPADGNRLLGGMAADGRLVVTAAGATVYVHREIDGAWMQTDELTHQGMTVMALSPDGTRLAVAEGDGYIQLWDVSKSPAVRLRPAPAASRIDRLTVSGNGRYVGVAGFGGRAVYDLSRAAPQEVAGLTSDVRQDGLWSFCDHAPMAVFTGDVVHDLQASPARPISRQLPWADVAFVPGRNELLLFEPVASNLVLKRTPWRIDRHGTFLLDAPQQESTLPPWNVDLSSVDWDRGRFLAADGSSGKLRVYEFSRTGGPVVELTGVPHSGRWQCLSPSGDLVLQWSASADARVWDLASSPPAEFMVPVQGLAGAVAPNESYLLLADRYRTGINVHDWRIDRELLRIPMPGDVRSIHPHPDGRHVLTVNGNGSVYVLRLPDAVARLRDLPEPRAETPHVASLDALDPDLIPASQRFDGQPAELVAIIPDTRSATFSPDGRLLATVGAESGTVWDVSGTTPQKLDVGHARGSGCHPAFSADSRFVVFRETGNVWSVDPPELVANEDMPEMVGFAADAPCVLLSTPQGLEIAAYEITNRRRFLVSGDRQPVCPPRRGGTHAYEAWLRSWRPGIGRMLDFVGEDRVLVVDLHDRSRPIADIVSPIPLSDAILSDDGQLLAVFSSGGSAVVWDLQESPPREYTVATQSYQHEPYFTADGNTLIVPGALGLEFIDWAANRIVRKIELPHPLLAIARHPDGRHVAAATDSGICYVLRLSIPTSGTP